MHYIFDLDGTLINSLPGIAMALNASLSEFGLGAIPTHTVEQYIGDGSYVLCQRAAPSLSDEDTQKLDLAFRRHYATEWRNGTTIYPGINQMLEEIPSHHHLSILSNKPHDFAQEIVNALFPANTFAIILGQRENIAKKPDPSGIHQILKSSGHPDKTAYLIGDSTVDLTTANNANIHSIGITWGFESREDLTDLNPDHIVDDASTLSSLLNHF